MIKMIKLLYGEQVFCNLCGDRYYDVSPSNDKEMRIATKYGLCDSCITNREVIDKILEIEETYAKADILPSWWKTLWLDYIKYTVVISEKGKRKSVVRLNDRNKLRDKFIKSM